MGGLYAQPQCGPRPQRPADHLWGDSYFGDDKIVDVNVRGLQIKIEPEPSNPKYLTTVWGFGYKWVE